MVLLECGVLAINSGRCLSDSAGHSYRPQRSFGLTGVLSRQSTPAALSGAEG
jgi:hypothetical protein